MNHPPSNAVVPRILVADDSDTIQKVVRIALSRQPVKIEVASSWLDASGKVGSGIALLLLDVNLPGVGSDPARIKEVVASAGSVPVVVMQGSHDRSLTEATLKECGISHVIQKPFDSNELIAMVTGLAGLSKAPVAPSAPGPMSAPPPAAPATSMPPLVAPPLNENMFDIGDLPPVPADLIDSTRKGKKAFDIAPEDLFNLVPPPPPAPSAPPPPAAAFSVAPSVSAMPPPPSLPSSVEMAKQVRQAVEDYCDRHFRSLAIEVITAELRRLADEKARHLVDI